MREVFPARRGFFGAIFVTTLLVVCLSGLLTALARMENTVRMKPCTIFAVERSPGGKWVLTVMGKTILMNAPQIKSGFQKFSFVKKISPPGIRWCCRGLFELIDGISSLLCAH